MPITTIDQLTHDLIQARLLTQQQIDDALIQVGSRSQTPDDLLKVLEQTGTLTSYQTGRIRQDAADELVLGNYKIMYRNASGSFARVFRASRLSDGETFALKVLRKRWADDPTMVAQFQREAEMCQKLRHRNIVRIDEIEAERGYHYFVMEFVQGGNLKEFLQMRRKLSALDATRITLDAAQGLAYAISQGVTHRDIKLTNILMGMDGVAKLVDFGLGGDDESGDFESEDSEANARALEYGAIEKLPGARRNDPRSDLFFLGAVYYELLTGQPPWPATKKPDERRMSTRYTNIRPVRSIEPTLPNRVCEIVDRLLHPSASQRYQTAAEVSADLRKALNELDESKPANNKATSNGQPTILCVENRVKQQDALRQYLSKHGYRVMLVGDAQRGISRLNQNPPDCLILMGDSIGSEIGEVFQQAVSTANDQSVFTIAVLSEKQQKLAKKLKSLDRARVLVQPLKLRDLRATIEEGVKAKKQPNPLA
ncbi:serine/threonine-protein kinase [Thalassoroseus pseudoceratinae]|uniref:serine/threonine-protein kinase n=1 Tax=Thalassoroseus pseudoceratinae TaxID=2713176 RepID=UPI001421BF33|nr:serine/threonine-protein kinase [Thalassoroseus pseudoceratinae]